MCSTVGLQSSEEDRLAERLQRRDQRIVVAQQHLVIELASIQPLTTRLMSLKSQTMLRLSSDAGAHLDFRHGVVAVRMLADAVVVEQPVAVAEIDRLGD